jgi:hypothetical protein
VLESRTVVISINRPAKVVYDFLAEPTNLEQWGTNFGTRMRHLQGLDYLVDLPMGEAVLRFTRRNEFGVIDFTIFGKGQEPGPPFPARVYANGEGADVAITLFRFPGVTEEQHRSNWEWTVSDLSRLKAILEADVA